MRHIQVPVKEGYITKPILDAIKDEDRAVITWLLDHGATLEMESAEVKGGVCVTATISMVLEEK